VAAPAAAGADGTARWARQALTPLAVSTAPFG